MFTLADQSFMEEALRLAMRGRGGVEPNPMVGCVIVKDSQIITGGYHQIFGHAHAEANALNAAGEHARGATAYITLEPCCHREKKTPPCVTHLIRAGLSRIVVGCFDPNPSVNGAGCRQLREAGIQVDVGMREAQCRQLAAPFFARMLHRPYVTLKWAQSSDGKVAGGGGRRVQISNPASTLAIHALRGRSDGIMVGMATVVSDDPELTVRGVAALRHPLPVVLDTQGRFRATCRMAQTHAEVLVFHGPGVSGVVGQAVPIGEDRRLALAAVLRELATRYNMTHLLVECGPTLAQSFIDQNLADRVWVIRSALAIGQVAAPTAVEVPYPLTAQVMLDGDTLSEYLNPSSPVFFDKTPSADFLLASGAMTPSV